ncbi:AAA family ATPase [Demequina soli]|uniref:AAA family ATPase n=1 Tax=Demequina soli TaxID=1638987 RepID=UPI00078208F2|nr:AAA family ATPase [Demequina soli]
MTAPHGASTLVGRADHLDAIGRVIARQGSAPRVLLLEGDPGIGKSRLLAVASTAAHAARMRVLSAVGTEAEAHLPFAGLQQLLAGQAWETGWSGAGANGMAERDALRVALGLAEGPRPDPFLIARAVWRLLAATAEPVAVLVDDLHWWDEPTRDVLAMVARRIGHAPVVLVAATRPGYPAADLSAEVRKVGPVDEHDARALLAASAPGLSAPDTAAVLASAGGNPLALVELPHALDVVRAAGGASSPAVPLPARLEAAFTAHLHELPAWTRDALLLAALDPMVGIDALGEAVAMMRHEPARTVVLAPAVDAGLVTLDGDVPVMRHPLVRSGILADAALARRKVASASLARIVADPVRQAWHLSQSILGPDDAVADRLEAAAEVALARGALASAVAALERAADLTTTSALRGRRLLVAAQHASEMGATDGVRALVDRARRENLSTVDAARLQGVAETFRDTDAADAGRVHDLVDAAGHAGQAGDTRLAVDLLLAAGLRCWWADTGRRARGAVIDALDSLRVQAHGDARRALMREPAYIAALAVTEPVLRARQVTGLLHAVAHPGGADSGPTGGEAWRLLGMAAHAIGDSVSAVALLDRSAEDLRLHGRQGLLAHVLSMLVIVRLELGDLPRARGAVDEGLRLAELTGQPIWSAGTLVCAARAEVMAGHAAAALDMAARVEVTAGRAGLNDLLACVQMVRGLAALDAGEPRTAYDALRAMFMPGSPAFHQRERFDGVMPLARAAALAGTRHEIVDLIGDLERTARVTPSPLLHAHLAYARAALAEEPDQERLYREALARVGGEWRWVRAQTHASYGTWLEARGRSHEAAAHLAAARDGFEGTRVEGDARSVDPQAPRVVAR